MAIKKEKLEELDERMQRFGVQESDLVEKFILGSGKGGQKVNKTSSCVFLKHLPTGIEIKCQRERSRELNRYYARKELCEKIEQGLLKEKSEKQMAIAKLRRQKQRRTRRQKEKMLKGKKIRSSLKSNRSSPTGE